MYYLYHFCHVILKPWCLLLRWTSHIWFHASDSPRLNLHLKSLGWRTMSLYPLGFRLSIQRECRSFVFLRQNARIQPFTPSKPRTPWDRLYLILKSELQVKPKKVLTVLGWLDYTDWRYGCVGCELLPCLANKVKRQLFILDTVEKTSNFYYKKIRIVCDV